MCEAPFSLARCSWYVTHQRCTYTLPLAMPHFSLNTLYLFLLQSLLSDLPCLHTLSLAVAPTTLLPPPPFTAFPIPLHLSHACRLHCHPRSYTPLVLELIVNTTLNAATFYLFLARPFKWPNSEQWQRFMW